MLGRYYLNHIFEDDRALSIRTYTGHQSSSFEFSNIGDIGLNQIRFIDSFEVINHEILVYTKVGVYTFCRFTPTLNPITACTTTH